MINLDQLKFDHRFDALRYDIQKLIYNHESAISALKTLTKVVEERFNGLEIVASVPGELQHAVNKAKDVLNNQ